MTSRGGVKTSVGGSYREIGVALLLRLLKALADKKPPPEEEAAIDIGGMKSASGFDTCGD